MKIVITFGCLIFLLTACSPMTLTPTTTPTYSLAPTQRPTITPTKTSPEATVRQARPTLTPAPTRTPTETPTPTSTPLSIPTKQVLLQYGMFGGDGGSNTDFFLGRGTPQMILYADGQLLLRQKQSNWYRQATLTVHQMCSLLSQIKRTGFFDVIGDGLHDERDPIYAFGDTVLYSGGGSQYVIQVNGESHKIVYVYPDFEPYLIQPVSSTLQLVRTYSPGTKMIPYSAKYLVLWIERGLGNTAHMDPLPTPQPWPTQLPVLKHLLGDKNEGQTFIEGETVAPILKLFGNRPTSILFTEDGQGYYVIARPLLPHETPEKFSAYPYQDVEFDLPFKCH